MLINLSNHPFEKWPQNQLDAAKMYGSIADLPFPTIDPQAETLDIDFLADKYEIKVRKLLAGQSREMKFIHIMGELTFCFALIMRLQKYGITCLSSTTTRQTTDHPDGSKTTKFGFVRFREYCLPSQELYPKLNLK
jgi:hypothetical protein